MRVLLFDSLNLRYLSPRKFIYIILIGRQGQELRFIDYSVFVLHGLEAQFTFLFI